MCAQCFIVILYSLLVKRAPQIILALGPTKAEFVVARLKASFIEQCFSKLHVHFNPLRILLKCSFWDSAFLTNSQLMSTLLIWGPHFENQRCGAMVLIWLCIGILWDALRKHKCPTPRDFYSEGLDWGPIAVFKQTNNSVSRERDPLLHCRWEFKPMQSFCRLIWQYLPGSQCTPFPPKKSQLERQSEKGSLQIPTAGSHGKV